MTDVALSEESLVEQLSAIAACDGSVRLARRRLRDAGVEVAEKDLRRLKEDHAGMYQALTSERARSQEEAIAQEFREIAKLSQRVTKDFLEDLTDQIEQRGVEGIDYDLKRQLPQTVQALAKIQQVSVDKLLSITGRPQDGGGTDPMEAAKVLVQLGVLRPVDRPEIVEGTVEEA